MGFMKSMFNQAAAELGNSLSGGTGGSSSSSSSERTGGAAAKGPPPTPWEKAASMLDGIVAQVVKVDPDGVDIVCFGGEDELDWYRNIKNTKNLEEVVTDKGPGGACKMGAAMEEVIQDAFDKDMTTRPVSILVLTAGMPEDAADLDATLTKTVRRLAKDFDTCPLSVTFVQIGDHPKATEFLKHLDRNIQANSYSSGEIYDLVDTIKEEEIQAAMSEIKGSNGMTGGLIAGFAGAAAGVGGMYLYNKAQAKKRTAGWGGKWKLSYDGQEISELVVVDHLDGTITIDGFPSGDSLSGIYTNDEETGYTIQFTDPSDTIIMGTVEDEHAITWSDGTRWDEIPPDNGHWATYVAAGVGGAAVGGTTGYLLEKKFFNMASKKNQCDYIIVMDRSAMMDPIAMRNYMRAKKAAAKRAAAAAAAAERAEKEASEAAAYESEEEEMRHHPMSKRKFTNKEMKYEFVEWKNLPQKVKRECKNMGFHRPKWDTSEPPIDAHFEWWEDLTEKQREAAEYIGWDEGSWDTAYQDYDWDELPKLQRQAAKAAGYNRDTWGYDDPEDLDEWWDDLPKKKAQALAVLGWTKYAWDNGMH